MITTAKQLTTAYDNVSRQYWALRSAGHSQDAMLEGGLMQALRSGCASLAAALSGRLRATVAPELVEMSRNLLSRASAELDERAEGFWVAADVASAEIFGENRA